MARSARRKAAPPSAQMTMAMDVPPLTHAEIVPEVPELLPSSAQTAVAASSEPLQEHVSPVITRSPTLAEIDPRYAPQPPAFGAWLLKQKDRGGFIGELAKGAATDRAFPKAGDPEAVLNHLAKAGADGDMFEALDDAERVWLATV